jgi:hypothetical protein
VRLLLMPSNRYLFTMQEGESKFGPDPEEFQLSQRALAKKAKREAAAAAAAQAAADRRREEELGGVVDARKPKKPKSTPAAEQPERISTRESNRPRTSSAVDGNEGDAEEAHVAKVKKTRKSKEKSPLESPAVPRSYPDSAAWGPHVTLDGRIAAAIDDMARAPSFRILTLLQSMHLFFIAEILSNACWRRRALPRHCLSRVPSFLAPCATVLMCSGVPRRAAERLSHMLCL